MIYTYSVYILYSISHPKMSQKVFYVSSREKSAVLLRFISSAYTKLFLYSKGIIELQVEKDVNNTREKVYIKKSKFIFVWGKSGTRGSLSS